MQFTTLALATLLSVAQAVDVHVVAVGKNPGKNETALNFFPNKITAQPGSMVQFQFWAGNHTVTQSDFDNPCVPISRINTSATGVFSSFQPAAASAAKGEIPVYTIMVNDTKPIWLFCSQGPHCQNGMSMVINENTSANSSRSLENYQSLSKSAPQGSGELPAGSGGSAGGSNGGTGNNGGEAGAPGSGNSPSPVGNQPPTTSAPLSAGINLAAPSTLLIALGVGFMFL